MLNHVALVSLTQQITASDLAQTAAALQKQVIRDLAPIWNIEATVDAFPDLDSVPQDYWPIIVTDEPLQPGEDGFHNDQNNQPYSIVEFTPSWQLTCSHECCEMLVDPYGNRMMSGGSPDPNQGKVNILVEVCDPCEDAGNAYSINGILVSDFYTPNFFDPQQVPGVRYSYTGAITKPREVLKNGYLSWQDPESGAWYQETYFTSKPVIKPLQGMKRNEHSLRSQVDKLTKNPNHESSFKEAAAKHKPIMEMVARSSHFHSLAMKKEMGKYLSSQRK